MLDLRSPPGNRLETLKTELKGYHSIRVNDQWRLVFRWEAQTAWLLSQALNTTPEFWINLQAAYDLARSRPTAPVEPLAAVG